MNIKPLLHPLRHSLPQFCTKTSFQKSIQVSILGASTRLGIYTSFLLKQNPLISTLHLQGCNPISNIGVDLNFLDTRCKVQTYCGLGPSVAKAAKSADLVLILPTEEPKENTPLGERIMMEGKRVYNIALNCTLYAPRALLVVCVPPVSVMTPIVSEVFKKTNFYHPGRIIGSAALAQIKANTLLGRYQDLDPQNCYVPLLGGPDIDLAVPIFSQARPVEVLGPNGRQKLSARFRGVKPEDFPKTVGNPNFVESCALAESYALNSLVSTIGLGICGDEKALANVYLRSNAIDTCKYLVSTVRFSRGGVVHNFGVPQITKMELDLLERAALQLREREEMALDYIQYVESSGEDPKPPPFTEKEKKQQELLQQRILR